MSDDELWAAMQQAADVMRPRELAAAIHEAAVWQIAHGHAPRDVVASALALAASLGRNRGGSVQSRTLTLSIFRRVLEQAGPEFTSMQKGAPPGLQ